MCAAKREMFVQPSLSQQGAAPEYSPEGSSTGGGGGDGLVHRGRRKGKGGDIGSSIGEGEERGTSNMGSFISGKLREGAKYL